MSRSFGGDSGGARRRRPHRSAGRAALTALAALAGLTGCSDPGPAPIPAGTGTPSAGVSAGAPAAPSGAAVTNIGRPAASGPVAVVPEPARCPNQAISVAVLADTPTRSHQPWKGVEAATLVYVNVSGRACWLRGHPGVASYRQGGPVTQGSDRGTLGTAAEPLPVPRVVLAPGGAAYSEIQWFAGGADSRVDELGVIAPDLTLQLRVPVRWTVRDDVRPAITVYPVTAAPESGGLIGPAQDR